MQDEPVDDAPRMTLLNPYIYKVHCKNDKEMTIFISIFAFVSLILLGLVAGFADPEAKDKGCEFRMDIYAPLSASCVFSTIFLSVLAYLVPMPDPYFDHLIWFAIFGFFPLIGLGISMLASIITYQVTCSSQTRTVSLIFYWITSGIIALPGVLLLLFVLIQLLFSARYLHNMFGISNIKANRSQIALQALHDWLKGIKRDISPYEVFKDLYPVRFGGYTGFDEAQKQYLVAYHGKFYKDCKMFESIEKQRLELETNKANPEDLEANPRGFHPRLGSSIWRRRKKVGPFDCTLCDICKDDFSITDYCVQIHRCNHIFHELCCVAYSSSIPRCHFCEQVITIQPEHLEVKSDHQLMDANK